MHLCENFLNGPIPASFLFFSPSNNKCGINFNYTNLTSIYVVFGILTRGRRMVGTADRSNFCPKFFAKKFEQKKLQIVLDLVSSFSLFFFSSSFFLDKLLDRSQILIVFYTFKLSEYDLFRNVLRQVT